MEAPLKPKGKVLSLPRIILTEENGKRLQEWIDQLRESCPGIRIKKQDLLNWLINQRESRLSSADLKALRERFFNEIELAQWALGQLKAAKGRNENLTLAELIRNGKAGSSENPSNKKKTPPKPQAEVPQIEVPSSGLGIRAD
jgi:hypothetical protein